MLLNILTYTGQSPTTKNYLAHNVSSANPWPTQPPIIDSSGRRKRESHQVGTRASLAMGNDC